MIFFLQMQLLALLQSTMSKPDHMHTINSVVMRKLICITEYKNIIIQTHLQENIIHTVQSNVESSRTKSTRPKMIYFIKI